MPEPAPPADERAIYEQLLRFLHVELRPGGMIRSCAPLRCAPCGSLAMRLGIDPPAVFVSCAACGAAVAGAPGPRPARRTTCPCEGAVFHVQHGDAFDEEGFIEDSAHAAMCVACGRLSLLSARATGGGR